VTNHYVNLPRTVNQARGIGEYAIQFIQGDQSTPGTDPIQAVQQFHWDSVGCAIAALAENCNAPRVLRDEALEYPVPRHGASCFGSSVRVAAEKAIVANCAAVRELDANGTNFGFNLRTGQTRGEFGHNDFYPVVMAAAQQVPLNGHQALRAMLCLDEIRGRLAEAFALKNHKIDHVVHGAIASAAVYGAILGATAEQIESAIGMLLAHYVPFRAIRAGHQLSDSKGASAAISTEMAAMCVHRSVRGFVGPADIFRNPQALFCLFERPLRPHESPFDLTFAMSGDDFAITGMHFKLGLYEHQSAGAIQGLVDLLGRHPDAMHDLEQLERVRIVIYEPAYSIIGDPAKRDPRTRQSADHSMVYIVATLLRKATELKVANWETLMLLPEDYSDYALFHPATRRMMERIEFVHGGLEFDARYPDGIPTLLELEHKNLGKLSSGLVMYPLGHARGNREQLLSLLRLKFCRLAARGVREPDRLWNHLSNLSELSADEIARLYEFPLH